jgi:hypothetical protein
MDFRKIASLAGAAVVVCGIWLSWWIQPARQVRRAQGRLLSTLEKRKFDSMAALIADAYSDRWQQDKAFVLRECRTVFSQFLFLTVEQAGTVAEPGAGTWIVRDRITLKGVGGPLAMLARDEVNALPGPFAMTWRRRGWTPWDWELISVDHPNLTLPR